MPESQSPGARLSTDYVSLLTEAKLRVRESVLWNRFIAGTPLENDIAVWMADLAIEAICDRENAQAASSRLSEPPADRLRAE